MHRIPSIVVLLLVALFMAACSEAPKTTETEQPKPAAGPSGPVTGKVAYWEIYKSAYSWAKDAVPLKLESKSVPGIKNEAGNAAIWNATFGSASRHEAIDITYAVAPLPPDIVKGINVGHGIPWAGPTHDVMPFQGSDIAVDSDAAYKTAAAKGEAWLKAHPDKPVSFLLGNNPNSFATPVWYVMWGDKKDGYFMFVSSKTGEIAKRVK